MHFAFLVCLIIHDLTLFLPKLSKTVLKFVLRLVYHKSAHWHDAIIWSY